MALKPSGKLYCSIRAIEHGASNMNGSGIAGSGLSLATSYGLLARKPEGVCHGGRALRRGPAGRRLDHHRRKPALRILQIALERRARGAAAGEEFRRPSRAAPRAGRVWRTQAAHPFAAGRRSFPLIGRTTALDPT